jgi:hypothetical protein
MDSRNKREFVWGRKAVDTKIEILNYEGKLEEQSFMTALNTNFTDLRFYSNKFLNRIYFPLCSLPFTKE